MASTARPPSARPGSSMPLTTRPGTASRLAAQEASSRTIPSTTSRPETGRRASAVVITGIPGERLKTGRTGIRSIRDRGSTRDRAYFIGALRSKLTDIINETNRLKNESKSLANIRDLSSATQVEYESLVKTVTDLRGTQHDYEAMLESVAKGVTNEDIQADIEDLQQQNGYLTTEVQELLNERETREVQLKKLQDRVKKYEAAGEALLREMSEEDQVRYREMQRELDVQTEVEERFLSDYESIKNGERAKLEEELAFSPLKKEAAQVYARIRDLQSTLDELREQTGRSPEQEQARLMEKIQSEQAEITALERQSQTLNDVRETIQQQMGGKRPSTGFAGQRDADRQVFLSNYREQHSELTNVLRKAEEENLRLLDQLNRNVAALNELPITTENDLLKSGQQFRSTVSQVKQEKLMREDLLQMTVEERSRELRKLETLWDTLTTEKTQRQTELSKWDKLSRTGVGVDLKTVLEAQNQEAQKELTYLEEKKRSVNDALQKISATLQQQRNTLENNPLHQKIISTESQLQQILAQTFEMDENLANSSADNSFESHKQLVMEKVKKVNKLLQSLADLEKVSEND